jgi:hypothetical protein
MYRLLLPVETNAQRQVSYEVGRSNGFWAALWAALRGALRGGKSTDA